MSDELQYGQPVLVYGCEDEPAYLARFWRGCGEPDRVWVVVFEQSRSPYPKLVLRERVAVCPEHDGLGDMPAWAWHDVAGSGRLEENLRLMTEAVRGQPWSAL